MKKILLSLLIGTAVLFPILLFLPKETEAYTNYPLLAFLLSFLTLFILAVPSCTLAHCLVAFFGWRQIFVLPWSLGMVLTGLLFLFISQEEDLRQPDILCFLGFALLAVFSYTLPYTFLAKREKAQERRTSIQKTTDDTDEHG